VSPSALAVRHPRFLAIAVLTSLVWGCVAFDQLPREEDPTLTWRLANVVTRLPGASPARIESQITDTLERVIEEVDEVEHIYSVSREGVSLLQIELRDDVTAAEPVWQKVRHKLSEARDDLPTGTVAPQLDDEIMGTYSQLIAVWNDDAADHANSRDVAQQLEDQIRYLSDTASTTLLGVQPQEVHVDVDPERLAARSMTFEQVAKAIRQRNTRLPSGRLDTGIHQLILETSGEFQSVKEIREMILLVTKSNQTLRLGDVADVRLTVVDPATIVTRFNGHDAVIVGVRALPNVRVDRHGLEVARVVQDVQKGLPANVHCRVIHDLAHYTRQRTKQLGRTLLLSITFVAISTFLLMGWRGAVIVTATIPITGMIVMTLFAMLGIALNQMSFMAIVMSFGLLVDNAIIVVEQIQRRTPDDGLQQSAINEPAKLLTPLAVSTLTTMAAFLPIYLLPGGVGEFVRAIPLGLTICLLTSLVIAMTVVPWLCVMMPTQTKWSSTSGAYLRFDGIATAYRVVLLRAVLHPRLTLFGIVAVMGICASLGLTLRRDFFSPVQRDQFLVDLYTPQGSTLHGTKVQTEAAEGVLREEARIVDIVTFVGRNAPLIFYNVSSQETLANNFAQLVVRVERWQDVAEVAAKVQEELTRQVPGAHCCVHILEHGAPLQAPFEIRIRGESIVSLREIGRRVTVLLRSTPGVRNVRTNYGNTAPRLIAEVNEPVARYAGIDQLQVTYALRSRFDGLNAGFLQDADERFDILVRLAPERRRDVNSLSSLYFTPENTDAFVPYTSVATTEIEWEDFSIYRRDGTRTLSVLAYPDFGLTAAQVAGRFRQKIASLEKTLASNYEIDLGGENEQRVEAERNLLAGGVYTFFLVVLLLVAEFRSLSLTAIILAVIPLSMAGALVALVLTGWPLNFMALMGMLMLMGVVVNDTVILLDGLERPCDESQNLADRVVKGAIERSRHIVITTVTTIAGFLPLAFTRSLLWPPLAIAIIGGLIMATMLTLFAVPAAYYWLRNTPSCPESS